MSVLPPFPGLPPTQSIENLPAPQMQLSQLPNGLRIASQETYGQLCNFGLFIDAGSRIETKNTTGTTQLMELMAFKSTCVTPTQATSAAPRPGLACARSIQFTLTDPMLHDPSHSACASRRPTAPQVPPVA